MSEQLRQLRRAADVLKASGSPYGDLTVVDRDNRISISSDAPLSEQRDNYTAGVSHLADESVIRIRANASTERITTVEQLAYSPGYTGEVGLALQVPEAPTGDQVVRWGYFGDDDGIRWGGMPNRCSSKIFARGPSIKRFGQPTGTAPSWGRLTIQRP